MVIKLAHCLWSLLAAILFSTVPVLAVELTLETSTNEAVEGGEIVIGCTVTDGTIGMLLFWYKEQIEGEEVQIGTMAVLNDEFVSVGRYTLEEDTSAGYTVTLTISGAKAEDSGKFSCAVKGKNIDPSLRKTTEYITVKAPVEDVHMFSLETGDIDASAVTEYTDGQHVEMAAGQKYYFRCTASGGNPAPELGATLGDTDVSDHFEIVSTSEEEGGSPGLKQLKHKVSMTSTSAIVITNQMNAYQFKCTATSGDGSEKSIAIEPVMSFPPLLSCPEEVKASLYKTGIEIMCTVKSNPKLKSMSATWEISEDQNKTVSLSKPQDGHYDITVKAGATHDENKITLRIDQIFPQMFRPYWIGATNAMGTSYAQVTLVDDGSVAQDNLASFTTSSMFLTTLSICTSLWTICNYHTSA